MKKRLMVILIVMLFILSISATTFAAGDPGMDGYEYIHSNDSLSLDSQWSHAHFNGGPDPDSVNLNVTRQKSTTWTAAASCTISAMVAEVGFSLEVAVGTTTTVGTSITYVCQGYYVTLCEYGSKKAYATGTENEWDMGTLIASRTRTCQWSYTSFSRKTPLYPYNP